MNRFFRSAFFPLIVIVLLVWLASQVLIKSSSSKQPTYGALMAKIRKDPGAYSQQYFVFNPSKRAIAAIVYPRGSSPRRRRPRPR